MSAIPNLPEHVLNAADPDADAAVKHRIKSQESAVHVEDIDQQVNGVANSNGIETGTQWSIHDTPIENQRPIKVIVIGAGFSGIYCGIRIPERIRNCELVIYEKNAGVGGAWWENRYPGAACDVPSHSYQFSFNPNPEWSALYAPSWEIREYLRSTAEKYGADRFIKLQHTVTRCNWNQDEGKYCNVLINARGLLNNKQWPDIEGLSSFQGEVMHSAGWNVEYDFTNKRIGVIGGGSSAIQIIPNLQKLPGVKLNCFLRGRFWISPPFGQTVFEQIGLGNSTHFTPEQIQKFKTDPQAWQNFRILVEADSNAIHASTLKGTKMQLAGQKYFEQIMKERLTSKPQYFDWLKPSFAPGCKRLTPGPGFPRSSGSRQRHIRSR
ncbi:FAD-binding monooxygenase aflW [Pseudocercospora fuligena]|uniref:FAD-binding monooxygenase aflW n=1 Tax=Pseudocercospora fuligena TaxID=685502 RepID=A0A8H6R761_9PEZI|nr:FAD-binding monooxygenase aflW [Pseudocercospora fuligena]